MGPDMPKYSVLIWNADLGMYGVGTLALVAENLNVNG